MLTLRLLGGLTLWSDGNALGGRAVQKRRLALLTLLASAPTRVMSRDKLIGLLWPESDREQARHLLSVGLYELRKSLGEKVVLSRGDDVALARDELATDVAEFEEALAAEDLDRAAEVYGGDFLDGFFISDAPEFERWVDAERDRLSRRYVAALERLADLRAASGDRHGAVDAWRRLSNREPFSSRIARGLMEALAAADDRAGALRHARAHEALLKEEFGSELGADITALVKRLREDRAPTLPVDVPIALPAESTPDSASLAVLPFSELTASSETRSFVDGLTDEVTAALSRVPGLLVAARSSTAAVRDRGLDIRATGRALCVRSVLEGSVRRAGSRVRIVVSLIDIESGYSLWGETYDRSGDDEFSAQAQIAREIAAGIGEVLTERGTPLVPVSTPDADAHELYLKGRFHWYRRTTEDLKQALAYFEAAVARDPRYALAYAGIGDVYSLLGAHDYGVLPPGETFPAAKSALARALSLDPRSASAHAALGNVHLTYDWDWRAAESEFRRALDLDPGCGPAYHWYALLLLLTGHSDEAMAAMRRARELEPLSLVMSTGVARLLYFTRQKARAVEEYRRTLEVDPSFVTAHLGLGLCHLELGNTEAAIGEYREANALVGGELPLALSLIAHAAAVGGRSDDARATLAHLEWESQARYIPAEYFALIYIGLGEHELAMDHLDRAYVNRSGSMAFLRFDPLLDPLRGQKRFEELQQRVLS